MDQHRQILGAVWPAYLDKIVSARVLEILSKPRVKKQLKKAMASGFTCVCVYVGLHVCTPVLLGRCITF